MTSCPLAAQVEVTTADGLGGHSAASGTTEHEQRFVSANAAGDRDKSSGNNRGRMVHASTGSCASRVAVLKQVLRLPQQPAQNHTMQCASRVAVLKHAVLMDAALVGKGVGAHNGLRGGLGGRGRNAQ